MVPYARFADELASPSAGLGFTHFLSVARLFVFPKDPVHLCDLMQQEEAAPYDGRPRGAIMLAIQITAEAGNPQHHLGQRWDPGGQSGRAMDPTGQRAPFAP